MPLCSKAPLLFICAVFLMACRSAPVSEKGIYTATGTGKPNSQEANPVNRKLQACMAAEFKAREALEVKLGKSEKSVSAARVAHKEYNANDGCTVILILD